MKERFLYPEDRQPNLFPPALFRVNAEGVLINQAGYRPYLSLEFLLAVKNHIDTSIRFAKENDIVALNNDYTQRQFDARDEWDKRAAVRKKTSKKTFVYLMIDNHTGLHKIGRSTNPKVREKTLLSAAPSIDLLFQCKGIVLDEIFLHSHFEGKRKRGEWFDLTTEDVEYIKSMAWQPKDHRC